ncbi:hypothetical protein RXV86_20205 [Alisedimentitalea sp. MJ-SS2]|uniref:hypothetical protein n=1 Tax=Aliisedimentitalea sp. MJ-SS2 TaxID=3049795 RepID=UPI00290E2242|nr:hypothetical protein [Alisedimentitalea sp. MJ-SS2]MDU8929715.1 hypothetical protein [Alisedimentitalea sp. MJ-SS2]
MKTPALFACVMLSACTPLGLFYKAGTPVARADRDLLNCRVTAENKVPARMVTRVIPGPVLPPQRICTAAGVCRMVPGRHLPPEIVTEDANAGLRREVVAQCMGDRGYEYVRIPHCPAGIANAVTPQQTKVMPRLAANSCVIRGQGGVWQIVTPG